jgi:hypothetical protein
VATRLDLQKSSADSDEEGSGRSAQQKRDSIGISFLDPSDVRTRAALGVSPSAVVRTCSGCLLRSVHANSILRAGHSALLATGRYAAIVALIVAPTGLVRVVLKHYATPSSATPSGRHPEISLRYFKLEDTLHVEPLSSVKRREHIVRIASSVAGEDQYLLNSGLFYYEEKRRRDADVFCSCPRLGCRGRVACPRTADWNVTCFVCHMQFT